MLLLIIFLSIGFLPCNRFVFSDEKLFYISPKIPYQIFRHPVTEFDTGKPNNHYQTTNLVEFFRTCQGLYQSQLIWVVKIFIDTK